MSDGHIRQRSPGSFEIRVTLPREPGRKRRTRTETIRGTKADARRRLRELLTEIDRGVVSYAGKMTVAAWLQQWLAETRHTVSPKTHEERTAYVRRLTAALGAIPLTRLSAPHIQSFYGDVLAAGRLDGKGGLSPQTVRHLDRTLHTAMERAVELRLIALNPVKKAKAPAVPERTLTTLDIAQKTALLAAAAASGITMHTIVFLALASGLRRGELLALTWGAIDLDGGCLQVAQATEQTRAGVRIKAPKTRKGRRIVSLPAAAVDLLRRYKITQAEEHLRLGLGKPELLFPREAADPREFSKAFARLADRAGVDTTLHDLRHTHVTDLVNAGVNAKTVSDRAGHSSVAFTMQRYFHTTAEMDRQAAQQLDAVLRRALGTQSGSSGSGGAG
jgi:integrase